MNCVDSMLTNTNNIKEVRNPMNEILKIKLRKENVCYQKYSYTLKSQNKIDKPNNSLLNWKNKKKRMKQELITASFESLQANIIYIYISWIQRTKDRFYTMHWLLVLTRSNETSDLWTWCGNLIHFTKTFGILWPPLCPPSNNLRPLFKLEQVLALNFPHIPKVALTRHRS